MFIIFAKASMDIIPNYKYVMKYQYDCYCVHMLVSEP